MKKEKDTGRGKLQWHPAFFQAMQMELDTYMDSLEFRHEYQLTAEPLRMDLLIIKKPKDLFIEKNIARIFRSDNILEYKSPEDYISVKSFLKVYAYANLYAAITPGVVLDDITLTFIGNRHPRKLLKYLAEARKYTVKETSPGIYRISGDYLPIQIVESGKLSGEENLWLKSLTNNLEIRNINAILEKGNEQAKEGGIDAYIDIILRANEKTLTEAKKMRKWESTLFEIAERNGMDLLEIAERNGMYQKWVDQGIEKGREEGMEKGLETVVRNASAQGLSLDIIQTITGLDKNTIIGIQGKSV